MSSHAKENASGARRFLAVHFDNLGAQLTSVKLGMWLFLASELLFFGGLFAAYAVYRGNNPELFKYGQYFLDYRLGALNTAVLIGSSLTAAWAVRAAQLEKQRELVTSVVLTILLACTFLVVKFFEYKHKIEGHIGLGIFQPSSEFLAELPAAVRALPVPQNMVRFFSIYYVMTGLHGVHVLVGIGLFTYILRRARRGDFSRQYYGPVDVVALYWHIVDIIWIFLFPLFYLIG